MTINQILIATKNNLKDERNFLTYLIIIIFYYEYMSKYKNEGTII